MTNPILSIQLPFFTLNNTKNKYLCIPWLFIKTQHYKNKSIIKSNHL